MLLELHVRDLALVDEVWLEFGPGMTVLTGETGAGKTVLVGALKLLLGERADASLVRAGADEALVEGRLELNGEEVLIRRRVSAEGRSKCTVDGEMSTVGALAELLGPLVDLHGQHDHQALLSPAAHAGYLDRFAGEGSYEALEGYRAAFAEMQRRSSEVRSLRGALADRERQADYLRFQIQDIDAVAPRIGEDEDLEALLPRLRFAERLTSASSAAYQVLRGEAGATDMLAESLSAMSAAHDLDPAFDVMREELVSLASDIESLASRMREYGESVEHDPRALETAESRVASLAALKRKYGPGIDDVLGVREEAERQLNALEAGEEGIAEAERRLGEAIEALRASGERVVALRDAVTEGFVESLTAQARDLALPNCVFDIQRATLPFENWTEDGPEKVEFMFSASAGDPPRPLARIASGGEISRVMLALKGVLGAADRTPVLVFDEVDTGIGGATAHAVGERLAALSAGRQVLVVTHLAQVAAFAESQVVVIKTELDGRSVTRTRAVEGEDRVAEIARMLSGDASDVSLAHARELLERVSSR